MYKRVLIFALLILAACSGGGRVESFQDLPAGDAARGAELFAQQVSGAPACATCHLLDETILLGPGLQGYGAFAGSMVSGMSAQDYTFQSITQPSAFIVSGFANKMYNNYAAKLSPQNLADLIAFLLTQ